MKVSAYTVDLTLDAERGMLYNTLSREYYVYQKAQSKELWNFLAHVNHGIHCMDNVELMATLHQKHIIVQDETDELCELKYLENIKRYANDRFCLKIIVTNGCDFRCTYCDEAWLTMPINDNTVDKLLRLVEQITSKVRYLYIEWCGGEPMLEYERICRVMMQVSDMCHKNICELQSKMYTNGYLLNEKNVKRLHDVGIDELYITIDGDECEHNQHRKDIYGQDTYQNIVKNVLILLKSGMKLTLQIHVDEKREKESFDILDDIPRKYRDLMKVKFISAPWNEHCISVYRYMRNAMTLGYQCHERYNTYVQCHACCSNSLIVDMHGAILLCSKAKGGEQCIGYLDEEGQAKIEKEHLLYQIRSISAIDNEACRNCQELPLCLGDCRKRRSKDNTNCVHQEEKRLTIEEVAWLDYYSDKRLDEIGK